MEGSKASYERQRSSVDISSSNSDDSRRRTCHVQSVTSKDAQLEFTKAEIGEVRKENERLRMHLDRMMKDYQELQKQFQKATTKEHDHVTTDDRRSGESEEEDELVSLSLGRTLSTEIKHQGIVVKGKLGNSDRDGLGLGLGDYNYNKMLYEKSRSEEDAPPPPVKVLPPLPELENISSSAEDTANEEPAPVGGSSNLPPPKVLKRREFENSEPSSSHSSNGKRARVCLRIRCETPTMNDGCQWRKYGQKIAKGNPCPRAYYRCTVATACPVRKQVQRCAEDMSILIITYEGAHNHPLPISATGMASTTSAAASMLLSGPTNSNTSMPTTTSLNGLSYYPPNTFSNKPQYQIPTSISSSSNPNPNHQTITLDLTSQNNNTSNSIPSHNTTHFSLFPTSRPTSLSFTSSSSQWGNSSNNIYCYNSTVSSLEHNNSFYKSSMQRYSNNVSNGDNKTDSTRMTAAAITSDPSFQSALAAAITTIIGSRESGQFQGLISDPQHGSLTNNFTLRQPTQATGGVQKSTSTSPGVSIKENST